MTAVASEGVPETRHQLQQRLRSTVLGPRGGGTTRRRASDAFRLALAIVVVLVSIPVMRANSAAELTIVRAVHPPPAAISWLVTSVFWLGSAGVIVLLVIVGLLVPRLTAVRWTAVAGLLTWGVCALLGVLLGSAAGRPPTDALAGLNAGYPVTQLAVAVAVAATALQHHKDLLPRLREAVANGAGIEVPKLAEAKRVSWPNLLFAVGSMIGIWLIIGMIAGLTSAGIPQEQAVAAVLIQRFFTSYLPPVWGWATLAWMRRREYV